MLAERENRLEVILVRVEEGVGMFRNGIEAAAESAECSEFYYVLSLYLLTFCFPVVFLAAMF
jgi:hypothetical protein